MRCARREGVAIPVSIVQSLTAADATILTDALEIQRRHTADQVIIVDVHAVEFRERPERLWDCPIQTVVVEAQGFQLGQPTDR